MKHLHHSALAGAALLRAAAAAFAQRFSASPKPATAAMADLYKDVDQVGETMPNPRRPAGGNRMYVFALPK